GHQMKQAVHKTVLLEDNRSMTLTSSPEQTALLLTLRQLNRYLISLEDYISKCFEECAVKSEKELAKDPTRKTKDDFPPLLLLVMDHWDEFVWTFRSVGLRVCGAKYTGNFNKLKVREGVKV